MLASEENITIECYEQLHYTNNTSRPFRLLPVVRDPVLFMKISVERF